MLGSDEAMKRRSDEDQSTLPGQAHANAGRGPGLLIGLIALLLSSSLHAAWIDSSWPFRRQIDIDIPADKPFGADEVAVVEFYTGGHHASSKENIRVHAEDGRIVPARVLMIGPGDRMRVALAPLRGVKRYHVYFGHPNPPPPPKNMDQVPAKRGLLLEMRVPKARSVDNAQQIEAAFRDATQPVGAAFFPKLYLGFNPFGEQLAVVSRFSGTLTAPADGNYTFAGAASDRGALYIDGKVVLWVPDAPGDVRHSAKVDLKKGPHDLVFYHFNTAGEIRVSVAWKPPEAPGFNLIPGDAFGALAKATVGPLEEPGKPIVADFRVEYLGECFYAEHYAHRYRFTVQTYKPLPPGAKHSFEWDFGDGQTLSTAAPVVEHVYLTEGEHAVKLTIKAGQQSDARTNRIRVSRLYERIDNPPSDLPSEVAKLVANDDVAKMNPNQLVWASLLFQRSELADALERAALRLATTRDGVDVGLARTSLMSAAEKLAQLNRVDAAVKVLDEVPVDSAYQPDCAKELAAMLMWRAADFPRALKVLEPQLQKRSTDRELRRLHGMALVLNQRGVDGAKVLSSLTPDGPLDRQAALTGALARTIEYYISDEDARSAEDYWEKWQRQYPADFLEGYSVLLRVRITELYKDPRAAARIAENFAIALPKSSYAPRLLDRASKLLERVDAAKSASLRATLKQRYPEDPLSQ